MQWGTVSRAPGPRPLLPDSLRAAGAALLAACVAVVLVAFVAGRGNPGRLDTALDPRFQAWLGRFPTLLNWLPHLGGLKAVTVLTAALALACVATRRWSGAVLAVVAVPGAVGLTEYVLKPSVGAALDQGFPSGHATSSFALAAVFAILLTDPAYRRVPGALRLLLALMAVPKEVDHPARRRELADAACRVIARNGLAGTTLAHVAEESGWSIGAIRYYFPDKDELVGSALWRVGELVDERIRRRTASGMTLNDLRIAAIELLPLDADGREMALVYLAFLAQAAVVPALAGAAEGAAQRLQEPIAARIAHLVQAGELPAHLDAEHEAARLRVLLDGLRLQLITTPRQTSASWALAVLDDHLTALTDPPAASKPASSRASTGLT